MGLLLGGAPACAGTGASAGDEAEPEDYGDTVLYVDNRSWRDMNIYFLRGGTSVRLGTVTSMNQATFQLPEELVANSQGGDVQLMADPVGELESYFSGPVHLYPGERVEWRLENNLTHSSLRVF